MTEAQKNLWRTLEILSEEDPKDKQPTPAFARKLMEGVE